VILLWKKCMASGATRQSSRFGQRARCQPLTAAPVFGAVSPAGAQVEPTPVKTRQHPSYSDVAPARACWPQYCIDLVTGEFGVGHGPPRVDDTAICTIDRHAWSALVTWRPVRLHDVGFKTEQRVTQTSDTSATGVTANSFQKHLVGINATAQV
jgi:hypothetical protein